MKSIRPASAATSVAALMPQSTVMRSLVPDWYNDSSAAAFSP